MKFNQTYQVTKAHTAKHMGSGTLDVLATPSLVAMVENACMISVESMLEVGSTTVGTFFDIAHIRPTKVGADVSIELEMECSEDFKRFAFKYSVFEKGHKVASGMHKRVAVEIEPFLERLK